MRPHRGQPTRLPCPWDSPGKNTGLGCHFLLLCMKVKSESNVAQSCPTLSDPMDCSLPGSSVHGIFQARVLEWGAIAFSLSIMTQHNDKVKHLEQTRYFSFGLQIYIANRLLVISWLIMQILVWGKTQQKIQHLSLDSSIIFPIQVGDQRWEI